MVYSGKPSFFFNLTWIAVTSSSILASGWVPLYQVIWAGGRAPEALEQFAGQVHAFPTFNSNFKSPAQQSDLPALPDGANAKVEISVLRIGAGDLDPLRADCAKEKKIKRREIRRKIAGNGRPQKKCSHGNTKVKENVLAFSFFFSFSVKGAAAEAKKKVCLQSLVC